MKLPDDTQRLSIVGRTGSGKTVAAVWHFSLADWDDKPWIVYDFKRDSLIARIAALDGVHEIGTGEVPQRAGIYIVHPMPDSKDEVEAQMWGIWANENTGVFVDEGYMVCGPSNTNSAFRALLTQGRSKHIPMFVLSQRPVWLDRFVFSESDFYQIFHLNHRGDRMKVMEYIPDANINRALPQYHSYYHDVARGKTVVLKPVPTADEVIATFARRLEEMKPKKTRMFV